LFALGGSTVAYYAAVEFSAPSPSQVVRLALGWTAFIVVPARWTQRQPVLWRAVLPPGLLGAAIQHELTGIAGPHPVWVARFVCVGAGVVASLLAVRLLRWDRGDHR
jgi:hypothetical protein